MRTALLAGELRDAIPLVPRHRLRGYELGGMRGAQRGLGSEVSGTRPYEPGDDVRKIDWAASARLSAARGSDEFLVREHDADLAPRVLVVADRRPGMRLYPRPWLDKTAACAHVERLVAASAQRERALVGLVELLAGEVVWYPAVARPLEPGLRRLSASYPAPRRPLARALDLLTRERPVPAGSFVFVVSDFLEPLPEPELVVAAARRLDVVPVVVQDPTWEASFPEAVGGLVLPLADPATGQPADVRLSRAEARARRSAHESRRAALLGRLVELGLEPVAVDGDDSQSVLRALLEWAQARLLAAGRAA